MSDPIDYEVGQRVIIGSVGIQNIRNGNRSIKASPCDSYVKKAEAIHGAGTIGIVTHRFPPGYEMTVDFNGQLMHMKGHWVQNAEAAVQPRRGRPSVV